MVKIGRRLDCALQTRDLAAQLLVWSLKRERMAGLHPLTGYLARS